MTIEKRDKGGMMDSYTPGAYSGCGCGSRRYYTKAEIDEMLANIIDEDKIKEILDQMFEEYIEEGDLEQLILNIIGDVYTKDEIDAMFAALDISGKLDTTVFTAYTASTESWKNNMEECCNDVNGMIEYLLGKISDLEETIDEITGSTPTPPGPDTGDTGDTPSSDSYVLVTYNVTSTTEPTKILNTTEQVSSIETANGVTIPLSLYYTFNDTGLQTLKFIYDLKGYTAGSQWQNLQQIVSATFEYMRAGQYAFNNSSLQSLTVSIHSGSVVWTKGDGFYSFANCKSLSTVNYGSGYGEPRFAVFSGCTALNQDFVIAEGVTDIEASAFRKSGLRSLTIPASMREIERNALDGCTNIQYVRFKGTTPPTINSNSIGGTGYSFPIYVPASAVDTYKQQLSGYANRIQAWTGQ